jgi:RimJ/RimL family protein N-acetyltransferase
MPLAPILTGKHLHLTSLTAEDADIIAGWYENEDFARSLMGSPDIIQTRESIYARIQQTQKSQGLFIFGARTLDNQELVGLLDIDRIFWHFRTCGISMAISPQHWGKGYGTEALSLLLNFCFYEINMYRVELSVFSYNTAAIRLYEKVGFTKEGVSRSFMERNGQRYDDIHYGMLRDEWAKISNI